jgi:enoyl-CoA hydratase
LTPSEPSISVWSTGWWPPAALDEAVALAERIAVDGPQAVAAVKHLMLAAMDLPREEYFQLQNGVSATLSGSPEAEEGALAFIEKRAPRWEGP